MLRTAQEVFQLSLLAALLVSVLTVIVTSEPTVSSASMIPTPPAAQSPGCPRQVLHDMSLRRRVGQLFVSGADSTGPTRDQLRVIRGRHLGGAILIGRSDAGVSATRQITRRLQAHSSGPARLWIAADQEGGYVQVLHGSGFSDIPTALDQGGLRPHRLKADAKRWGQQLRSAGVNLDLAPVGDTVPARLGTGNPPIGYYYREYGHRPGAVAKHARAVWRGLRAAHVQATAKHFPGLGRVHKNTDTSARVTDRKTTRDDPYLRPFRALVNDRIPVVMVSSARYTRIDRHHRAAFSSRIMRGMLRADLDFAGVIMSDDFGAAAAVQGVPAGKRAVRFISAGGTVVLTVSATIVPAMVHAVLHRARKHQHFRSLVRSAALKVLHSKNGVGLLSCGPSRTWRYR